MLAGTNAGSAQLLDWSRDEKDRMTATDDATGMRYRIAGDGPCQLVVLSGNSRRSCERSDHPDVAAAMAQANARVLHELELIPLGRTKRQSRVRTPWGTARSCTDHGEGVLLYSAAEQDGFHLSEEANARMPLALRLPDGWYHDDGDSARVVIAMPHLFTSLERRDAEQAAAEAFPDLLDGARDALTA